VNRYRPILIAAWIVGLLLVPAPPAPASGQETRGAGAGEPAGPEESRVFTVRYKNIDDVYLKISPYLGPRGSIQSQPHQKTLTVQDSPDRLRRIAEVIAAYDVPPRSVEVSVQLILASSTEGQPEEAPPPIRGVIEKLNALSTRWNDYRMLGSARVLGTEGERSSLRVGDDYRVDFRIDQVMEETRVIRFRPFELQRREPTAEHEDRYAPVMNTVLNLRDAQLFIVGASRMEHSNRALFMTITAAVHRP